MSGFAVQTRNLGRAFRDLWAVKGLDLDVRKGEIFGLVGPDGAGKTTTMRLLAGVLVPSEGEAWVDELSVVHEAEEIKKRIGYMSQKFGLYGDLTVEENLLFYGDLFEIPEETRAPLEEKLLGFSNLTPFRKRLARDLSGGMKQKLGLACALIHHPKVLLLDEPTNGVDPVSRRDFWKILYEMAREGVSIFVSTSYLDEAERCSRVGFMDSGTLILSDTPRAIRDILSGSMVEIEVKEPRKAIQMIRRIYGENRSDLFSDKIRFRLSPTMSPDSIRSDLEREGLTINGIRLARPTLEDVFVSRAGSGDEEHGELR